MKLPKKSLVMGDCIKVIKTKIDTKKIIHQLEKNPGDWGSQQKLKNVELKDPHTHITTVDVLQLIMGGIEKPGQIVGDTEICIKTPAYEHHSEIRKILKKYFNKIDRCGFLSLPIDEIVGAHIDEGTYYLTRDRYHLSISGRYQYFVGNESIIVEPGTLFWFDNKQPHGTVNIGDEVRITFVFDVPHSPDNPQHKIDG
jgi:mannose-6-phosphate isomerase-like protein (cupin superfamily)